MVEDRAFAFSMSTGRLVSVSPLVLRGASAPGLLLVS